MLADALVLLLEFASDWFLPDLWFYSDREQTKRRRLARIRSARKSLSKAVQG